MIKIGIPSKGRLRKDTLKVFSRKKLKIFSAVLGKNFHLLNVFFVILAFRRINGIFFAPALSIKFGHISESTKKITSGFQSDKKLLTKK